ncbi:MAG: RNA polymerase sporulation sigma factor SigK [Lachnospiraceae bacterium]|nr:RNA polymerase sporulation sigma factor SigK [Lachnospiraceae bacterium]MBO5145826.1 RNA polymerase sporulation sigma factor SigK [Lachnospiraceae bacterium]
MKTFEQPLSAKEETAYLEIMNGGDLEAAHKARQILIERNLRLVAHVSKKYMGCGEDMEDLISIGTIGLIKAVNTFKAEKGSRLATYAAKCIDNELLMMFRARKKVTREISLYEPIGTDKEGNEINLIDVCEQEQRDVVEDMDMLAKMKCLSSLIEERLDDREREIIKMRYGMLGKSFTGEEMTQRDIGNLLGISRSYVSRIEKKALSKLKEGLAEANLY